MEDQIFNRNSPILWGLVFVFLGTLWFVHSYKRAKKESYGSKGLLKDILQLMVPNGPSVVPSFIGPIGFILLGVYMVFQG